MYNERVSKIYKTIKEFFNLHSEEISRKELIQLVQNKVKDDLSKNYISNQVDLILKILEEERVIKKIDRGVWISLIASNISDFEDSYLSVNDEVKYPLFLAEELNENYTEENFLRLFNSESENDKIILIYLLKSIKNIDWLYDNLSKKNEEMIIFVLINLFQIDEVPNSIGKNQLYIIDEYLNKFKNLPKKLIKTFKIKIGKNLEEVLKIDECNEIPIGSNNKKVAIIVHGTWALDEDWWRKGSPFWNFVKANWQHLYDQDIPYCWSGLLNDDSRLEAAERLIRWFNKTNAESLDIIAHSHGGNVCLLAATLGLKIDKLILLGTPITLKYNLNLDNINIIKNVYSLGDQIQYWGAFYDRMRFEGRTLGDCKEVSNKIANCNSIGQKPDHSQLHEEQTWLNSGLMPLF